MGSPDPPQAFLASNESRDQQLVANQARTEAHRIGIEKTRVGACTPERWDTLKAHPGVLTADQLHSSQDGGSDSSENDPMRQECAVVWDAAAIRQRPKGGQLELLQLTRTSDLGNAAHSSINS